MCPIDQVVSYGIPPPLRLKRAVLSQQSQQQFFNHSVTLLKTVGLSEAGTDRAAQNCKMAAEASWGNGVVSYFVSS